MEIIANDDGDFNKFKEFVEDDGALDFEDWDEEPPGFDDEPAPEPDFDFYDVCNMGYTPIPGPRMQVHPHFKYVDREAPALPASEWLMERIHHGGGQLLAFSPPPNVAGCVLLRFERKGNRWFCDFHESSRVVRIRETLVYRSGETVVSLALRGGAITNNEPASVSAEESKPVTAASC